MQVAAQTLTRLCSVLVGLANSGRRLLGSRRSVMSEVLLIEVPPQFIALCINNEVTPQSVLRGMIGVLCALHIEESQQAVGLYATAVD
jgi:hypothetical protein